MGRQINLDSTPLSHQYSNQPLLGNLPDIQQHPDFIALGTRGFFGFELSGEGADRARAMLEAERRTTVVAHAQFDERVTGWGFGLWLLLFKWSRVEAKGAAHLAF